MLSKAEAYVTIKSWQYRQNDTQLILDTCPVNGCDNGHFYMNTTPEKDGLWDCKKCGVKGNLKSLKNMLGDRAIEGQTSLLDAATRVSGKLDALPDVDAMHQALFLDENAEVLDYLMLERGLELRTIEHFKIGVTTGINEGKFPGAKWIAIPYFVNSTAVNFKFRTAPPADKGFHCLSGREVPLFNVDDLKPGLDEYILAEGEIDTMTLWQHGFVAGGLPGANTQKAAWIDKLDECAPVNLYLCLDNDKVGQKAAKEMAKRIGIDKVKNIVLPSEIGEHSVKDVNEFFLHELCGETFSTFLEKAKPFSIDGIQPVGEVIDELLDTLKGGKKIGPQFVTPWESVNARIGGFSEGYLVGILAPEKVGKTTMAMNLLDFMVRTYGHAGLLYCLEMTTQDLVKKWLSHKVQCPTDELNVEKIQEGLAMAANYPADMLFGYTPNSKPEDVFDTIRQTHRRYGAKFTVFDNLQLLCRSIKYAAQETASVGKGFKNLAMELGQVIFLILQPRKLDDDGVATAEDIANSGMIAKDVDVLLCLHRNKILKVKGKDFDSFGKINTRESFAPQLLVNAELVRNAPGGMTTLYFAGETSTVKELGEAQQEQAKKTAAQYAETKAEDAPF